jgi:hypothetical protein
MATAQLTGGLGSQSADGTAVPAQLHAVTRIPLLLAGALLLVVLYAAFDHGAVGLAAGARIEVAIAVLAAVATVAWLGLDALRVPRSRLALAGVGLLAAFAIWCGVTLLWSVAPDQTWIEFNRALAYALVAGLGLALGASHPQARALLADGFFAVALLVALYALGQKLLPGLHIAGVFDLNQTGSIPRLQEPLGYWNGLALFAVLGAPLGLSRVFDVTRTPRSRLLAAGGAELLLLTTGLTLSRGGLVALAVALVVVVAGARERLRVLSWIVLVALASVPPLVYGLASHALNTAGVQLSTREGAGGILALILLASLAGLYLAGRGFIRVEKQLVLAPPRARRVRRLGMVTLVIVVVGGLTAAGVTHAWTGFTSASAPSNVSPNRLLTTDSYRWLWWKEAARAFAARPAGGWGAGSFGVVHLIYRQNTLPVQQPHSVPLQFLSETGIVGGLLGLGAFIILLAAAVRGARQSEIERGAAMALLAAAAAYLVHSLYDWDWNIPAVTLPALMFLGVLAGAGAPSAASQPSEAVRELLGLGGRAAGLTAMTLGLCFFISSSVLPSLAASDASAALLDASSGSPSALAAAQGKAKRAGSLDPLSDAGPRVAASIALHRGQLARARYYLEEAVGRNPSDEFAWSELATLDTYLRDASGVRQAARRVVTLDPRGRPAQALRNLAGYGR